MTAAHSAASKRRWADPVYRAKRLIALRAIEWTPDQSDLVDAAKAAPNP